MRALTQGALGTALAAMALHAQPAPEFEVASIRRSNPDQGFINATTPSLNVGGDRYLRFVQISLRDPIMLAYGVGAPDSGSEFSE